MRGAGGQQGGTTYGDTPATAHRIELAHGEGEHEPCRQHVGVHHAVQQRLVPNGREQVRPIQQPEAADVQQGRQRWEDEPADGTGSRENQQASSCPAVPEGSQGEGEGVGRDEQQRGGHADDEVLDHVPGERSSRHSSPRRPGRTDAPGGERHIPPSGPGIPAAPQTPRGQQIRHRHQQRGHDGEQLARPGSGGRAGVDVRECHDAGPAPLRRAARRARITPMSSRTRPAMFHAQSYGVTSTP